MKDDLGAMIQMAKNGKSMTRIGVAALGTMALLSACAPAVPDSAAGVGFTDYDTYAAQRAARDVQLETGGPQTVAVVPPAATVVSGPIGGDVPASAATLEATAEAALAAANSGETPVQASPANPAPVVLAGANTTAVTGANGISVENDFDAVASERSIQDDAARIAQNRAAYQQVAPTELPQRSGSDGPNIVTYALQTSNPVGQKIFTRVGFNAAARQARNCAKYPSPDLAQRAFLQNGGPQRDRLGLDPDGDGYACSWDPRPFRAVGRTGQG